MVSQEPPPKTTLGSGKMPKYWQQNEPLDIISTYFCWLVWQMRIFHLGPRWFIDNDHPKWWSLLVNILYIYIIGVILYVILKTYHPNYILYYDPLNIIYTWLAKILGVTGNSHLHYVQDAGASRSLKKSRRRWGSMGTWAPTMDRTRGSLICCWCYWNS